MSDEVKAQLMGVPVEQLRMNLQNTRNTRDLDRRERKIKLDAEKSELKSNKKFADFKDYEDEVNDILERVPSLSVKQAYYLAKSDDDFGAITREAEQRIIEAQARRNRKQVVKPSSTVVSNQKTKPISREIRETAAAFNMTPQEYMRYMDIESQDDYLRNTKKNKR
jgi:hypothetical protein